MTARNYDVVLTVANATDFRSGNAIVGSTSGTVGYIANVNATTKQIKVKLNNVIQEYTTTETVTSSSSIVGGYFVNTTVFTPVLTVTNISAAVASRTAGT